MTTTTMTTPATRKATQAAATAMATGFKTYDAAIGVDVDGNPVKNVLEAPEAKGNSTAVITSVPFSHATPAGFVAHIINRDDYGVGLPGK